MKKCPYCAEEIQDAAVKCRHCKESISIGDTVSKIGNNLMVIGLLLLFLVLIIIFLGGCAEMDATRRQNYINSYPNLSSSKKDSILNGKIQIGMTKEDVRASWGEPYQVVTSGSMWGASEQWTYGNCLYGCTSLFFSDDKLTDFVSMK